MSKQAITSRTRVLGVIGDPIEHSLSPLMHNHVLERLGLDYRYVAFHVQQNYGLHVGLAFRTLGLAGLNVTIPYKETVMGQMDVLTEEARIVGAVNTIGMNARGELVGHNTDVAGFLGALEIRECAGELAGRGAVVLGQGGPRAPRSMRWDFQAPGRFILPTAPRAGPRLLPAGFPIFSRILLWNWFPGQIYRRLTRLLTTP